MKKLFFVSAAALLSASAFAAPVYSLNSIRMEVAQEKKVEIKAEELPQAVKDTIAADYKDWTISKAYLYETVSEYEVEFKKGEEAKTVKFSKDGNVIG